jgi:hypothetical protein
MAVSPIHHRGDGEAAGEWGGCGGDRGHWGFRSVWLGGGEFIRVGEGRLRESCSLCRSGLNPDTQAVFKWTD